MLSLICFDSSTRSSPENEVQPLRAVWRPERRLPRHGIFLGPSNYVFIKVNRFARLDLIEDLLHFDAAVLLVQEPER